MSCPNCPIFLKTCQAECCTLAPIEQNIFVRNFDKIQKPVLKTADVGPGIIVPVTETGKCCFLKDDLSCAIHDDRPSLCRKFGDETHIMMTCAWQTADGKERNPKDRDKINRLQKEATDKRLGRK